MASKRQPDLSWEISISLVNNPFIFRVSVQLCLITWLVMTILLGVVFLAMEDFDALWPMMGVMTLVTFALWITMLLVMLLFFGNRTPMRFTIDRGGVTGEILSKRSKTANRLLVLLGILSRKPAAAGAGLIASSQETQTFEWERVYAVRCDEKRRTVTLRNRWRSLITLFCLPENYDDVLEIVKQKIPSRLGDQKREKNPLAALLSRTFLTVLACVLLFKLDYPFEVNLFIPVFILCFAMGTIWLIPLFGYVVIGATLFLAGILLFQGLQVHTSQYASLGSYLGFELLDGGEWFFMALVFFALLYLTWSSWRAVKGRDISALFLD